MRRIVTTMLLTLSINLSASSALLAGPPASPEPLTVEQFNHLRELESSPEHQPVQELHASFQSEREEKLEQTRLTDDILTGTYIFGMPLGIALVLIAAAPL